MRNEQKLAELLRHYGPLLRYIIAAIVHNTQDQEECILEVTLRVWKKDPE